MKKLLSACLILFSVVLSAYAADEKEATPAGDYAYYGFEPEIVTNYISNRKKLGFVKISVELMVKIPMISSSSSATIRCCAPRLLKCWVIRPKKRLSPSLAVKKSAVSASIW